MTVTAFVVVRPLMSSAVMVIRFSPGWSDRAGTDQCISQW
jgi:hypothetical protein